MRGSSLRSLIFRSATLFIAFNIVVVSTSPSRYDPPKNKGCAKHCLSGCKVRGPGKCDRACKPSFSLQRWSGKCIAKCGVGCMNCIRLKSTTYHHCRKCRPGFKMGIRPKTGETYCYGGPSNAVVCDPNCAGGCTQRKAKKCDATCNANYVLTSTFTCSGCDANCVATTPGSCTTPSTCSGSCKSGFFLVPDLQQCGACGTSCTSCQVHGSGLCDEGFCIGNTVFDSSSYFCAPCDEHCASTCATAGQGKCDGSCAPGYANTGAGGDNYCAPCADYCDSNGCSGAGPGYCDIGCLPGYTLVGNTCFACQSEPYCQADVRCVNEGECTADKCGANYSWDNDIKVCL